MRLLRAPLLDDLPHAFTTRDLDLRADREPAGLGERWRTLAIALGTRQVATLDQVHGAAVVRADGPSDPLRPLAQADALVTTRRGTLLAVRAADCLPVLLAAPGGVAAAHAGWRGVVAGVVPAALAALCEATGCAPDEVRAALGPHATGARFETGDDVVAALRAAGVPERDWLVAREGEKWRVDLAGAVVAQLRAAGVTAVERVAGCTLGEPGRFWSHRREGAAAGRQAGVIGLAA